MRWGYKTVHYELKKEGFLGSAFLDEAEVEQSLNEYGSAGWELVSMMETQDGLIAIFKQPLDPPVERWSVREEKRESVIFDNDYEDELITENDIIDNDVSEDDQEDDNGLRSIRIE